MSNDKEMDMAVIHVTCGDWHLEKWVYLPALAAHSAPENFLGALVSRMIREILEYVTKHKPKGISGWTTSIELNPVKNPKQIVETFLAGIMADWRKEKLGGGPQCGLS